MAPDDNSGAKPAGPVVLRIKLRYDDLDAMVQRFAPNVGKSGLFLPTKSMQPVGTEVKFELRLANDTPVLVGLGRVKHVRPPDPANPRAAFGIAIELMRVTREGREVIIRMIERRRVLGLPDVAIPLPDDVESARRADLESQPRADTSGIVREAMAQMASAPVAEQILTARPSTGPLATVKLESGPVIQSGPVVATGAVTAPVAATPAAPAARDSGPIGKPATFVAPRESGAITKPTIAALAPEAPRKHRPRIHELIAQAESGPIAAAPAELDEHVDLERAFARARALATGDLEVELAQLREEAAAPIEISVEAASAELARQLGGNAISRRDRSARWAPPPAVTPPAVTPEPEAPAAPAPVVASEPEPAQPVDDDDAFEADAPGTTTAVEPVETAHRSFTPPGTDDIATDPAAPSRQPALVVAEHEHADEDDEEIEELDDVDVVPDDDAPGESTQIGGMPVDPQAFAQHGQPTVPDELAARLDAHLDAAEREADDDLGIAHAQPGHEQAPHAYAPQDAAPQHEGHYTEGQYAEGQYSEGQYAEGQYAEGQYAEGQTQFPEGPTQYGDAPYAQGEFGEGEQNQHAQGDYAQGEYAHDEFAQGEYAAQAEDEEEISDLDVLAEADAADADLLTSHGEQEAPAAPAPAAYDYAAEGYAPPAHALGAQPSYPPAGEGSFDFAARLDLGDDESNHRRPAARPADPRRARSYGDGYDDGAPAYAERRREPSYGEERYDYDAPSSSYTFAERGGYEHDPYAEEAPAQLTPIASPPLPQPSVLRQPPPEDYDLENALEALDVDLDELSPAVRERRTPLPGLTPPSPRAASEIDTSRPRTRKAETPARALAAAKPAKPKRAATEDDGVLIDFDDDDE